MMQKSLFKNPKNMRVLVACEYSGIVRDAFTDRGHDAWSCDILETESKGNHIVGDVLEILDDGWDLMIAHPPCTHLSVTGQRWFVEGKKDPKLKEDAIEFVKKLMNAPIDKICIENPRSVISSYIRPANQTINPYQYGHLECKATCLWLKNLPKLKPTKNVKSETMLLPRKEKHRIWWIGGGTGKERSKFYTGFAQAMAEQWG
ncbi:MAG: DNA cytosine methyltransferase [Candidatus Actinomarinaceae bacterium]